FPSQRRRNHIALRVVRHLAVQILIDCKMTDGGGTYGVAVGWAAGQRSNADIAAGTGPVLDYEGLSEDVLQALAENTRKHVGRPARRIGHDDPDSVIRPVGLGTCAGCDQYTADGRL